MAKGLNSVQIIGNLGADPDLKYTNSGKAVVSASVGVTTYPETDTEWFKVEAWEKQAEAIAKAGKGTRMYFQGRLKTEKWTGKDGQERSRMKLVVRDFLFLDSRQQAQAQVQDDADDNVPFQSVPEAMADDSDDLPF
jgi:single-strand DNA-binding protein